MPASMLWVNVNYVTNSFRYFVKKRYLICAVRIMLCGMGEGGLVRIFIDFCEYRLSFLYCPVDNS